LVVGEKHLLELRLVVQKVESAQRTEEKFGLRFVKAFLFLSSSAVITDRLVVTDEAVKCLNPPMK
jgi:hypothetical protein